MAHKDLFVKGNWISGYGRPLKSFNPATNEIVWEGSRASPSDVDRAVKAAREAFFDWAARPLESRIPFLETYAALVKNHENEMAETISRETGKPLWESHQEVASMVSKINISIAAYRERCPEKTQDLPQGKSITRHKPHGVIAVLGPFNFPGHLPNGHIVPALLAGNTIVFKPSEFSPLTGMRMAEYWEESGLPAGVFNLLQGAKDVGQPLASHAGINGLFFTGSFAVGQALNEQFAKTPGKILALELGGNNPLIVDRVEDLQAAAYVVVQSAYLTSGQRCSCARRLIIIENEKSEQFLETLLSMIERIQVGSYQETPEPFMGPVIHETAALKLLSAQAALHSQGGKPLILVKHLLENTGRVTPGIIDVTGVKERPDHEIFGPLLQIIRVSDLDQAVQEANNTRFGLTAGILTDDEAQFQQFFLSARAGIINWNTPLTGASSSVPFGGIGCSGNYHPSAYYAADYCAYPVATIASSQLRMPEHILPGLEVSGIKT